MTSTTPLQKRNREIDLENPRSPPPSTPKMSDKSDDSRPRLIHPALHKLPQPLRFQISGAFNTTAFMVLLAIGNNVLKDSFPASTKYSICSLAYMPIGHAVTSLVVFGWPEKYLQNLMMNFPIGIVGTMIGSFSTGILVRNGFDSMVHGVLMSMYLVGDKPEDDDGTAYTNIAVLIITGVWGYVVSTLVNSKKPQKKHQKES